MDGRFTLNRGDRWNAYRHFIASFPLLYAALESAGLVPGSFDLAIVSVILTTVTGVAYDIAQREPRAVA